MLTGFKSSFILSIIFSASFLFNYVEVKGDEIYKDDDVDDIIGEIKFEVPKHKAEPSEMIEEGQKLSEEGLNWIEYVTERCLNKPVNFQGKQISLMDQFKDDCINHNIKGEDDDEN